MKRDFLTIRHRAMTHLESVAFALYAGNIINAADRNGVKVSCASRIRKAWDNDSRARERWVNVVQTIMERTDLNLVDLGGTNAELNRVPTRRKMRALDVASLVVIAAFLGTVTGYLLAQL